MRNHLGVSLLIALFLASCSSQQQHSTSAAKPQGDLAKGFANPPDSARPHTWWHWVSGNASKPGITADLEAMKRIGVGGAQMFFVDQVPNPKDRGSVLYMSEEWRALTRYAIAEANRLGLDLTIHDCEGWSESGGPWITPEMSMQKVVWSEEHVHGGSAFDEKLTQPETVKGFYRDIAVFAFPTLPGEQVNLQGLHPKITTSVSTTQPAATAGAGVDATTRLTDGDPRTSVRAMPGDDKAAWVLIELDQPVRAGSLSIAPLSAGPKGEVQVSDDGKNFRKVADVPAGRRERAGQTFVFDEVNTKWFRIFVANDSKPLVVGEIGVASARIPDFRAKTGLASPILPDHPPAVDVPADTIVHAAKVIDLTGKMDADGHLKWDAPDGEWTILRLGHTSTGKTNHPAMKETVGLECDKMSREAVKANFNGMLANVISDSRTLMGKGLKLVLMDSWEAGCQNWTPKFREEFQKRNGYDPLPWMIAMSGRYVESPEKTERFLWDYRRTIADLIAENHYALMKELCNQNHLLLTAEAPGIGMPTVADELQCKSHTDIPMGEFWVGQHNDNADPREAASAAHIFAKTIAAAESFTAGPENAKWTNDPYSLKAQGDEEYCAGINRFVFHRYAHQPDDRKPGMTMGPWGINFERSNTWWEPGRAWISYLTRCQYMLQRGLFVADLVYYYGEGAPREHQPSKLNPAPPAGYDYDGCDRSALMERMSVAKDGRIVLPDGMSYRVLVLADTDVMTPAVLAKVKKLVSDGATVVGRKPAASPSLKDYPKCDEEVRKVADELWGNIDGDNVKEHSFRKGRVCWNKPHQTGLEGQQEMQSWLRQVVAVERDFVSTKDGADAGFRFIHRRDGDADIYFVANPHENFAAVQCTFRVAGKAPQIWHPDSGAMEAAAAYTSDGKSTTLPIRFDPYGSVFVVFRKPPARGADPVVSIKRGDEEVLTQAVASPQQTPTLQIRKATYGVPGGPEEQQADVTAKVAGLVRDGRLNVQATNDMAGKDPKFGVSKSLTVDYTLGGTPMTKTVPENATLQIPEDVVLSGHPAAEAKSDGTLEIWERGDYTVTRASGKTASARVIALPLAAEISGAWDVHFPPNWGAPESVKLDRLIPLNEHDDVGVKHFSGTASYTHEVNITGEIAGPGKRVYLDLGMVKNLAEVSVNGKNLGILWKPPFRVDITDAVYPGPNQVEVKVTNLWPNRLIGDQSLPPTQRYTWTAYDSYKKDSPLLPSGLIGPVKLVPTVVVQLQK